MQNAAGEFLIVRADEDCFALATDCVRSVMALLPVTPLPFVPAYIDGLVGIGGQILPQLDLQRLLGAAAGNGDDELVLVDTARCACALRVSAILDKTAPESLQPLNADAGAAPVQARFEWQGRIVLVLDAAKLGGLVAAGELPAGERGLLGRHEAGAASIERALDAVVARIGTERFVIALADLVEILDLPPATPVPGAPAEVEGLALVREDVLLVLSLARLLQLPVAEAASARRCVLVVSYDDARYGLRVDGLEGLCQLDESRLRRLDDGDGELGGVLATEADLFGVLQPARLIGAERHRRLRPFAPQTQQREVRAERRLPVLEVTLGEETFGIALEQVRRIAGYCAPERLQDDSGAISGVVSLEGRVLPVLDVAGCLRAGHGNEGAWVIVGEGAREWAIAVRRAADILEIPESAVQEIGTGADGFVHAVATVDTRLISLLSLTPLLTAALALPS
jgi:purine-binding chemotaxis protein CheW